MTTPTLGSDDESTDESTDELLDTAFPVALLIAVASWLPAGVFLLGYAVRVLRAELAGDDDLPPLDDVRGLGWTGLRAAVLLTVCQIPTAISLGSVFLFWSVLDHGRGFGGGLGFTLTDPLAFARDTLTSPETSVLVVVGLVFTGVVAIVAGYVGTVALVTFAATDRLAAAFDPDTLLAGARSARFRRAFLLASALGFVGSGVAWLVALVPVVGPFGGAFVELFVLVGGLRIVADGYDVRAVARPARDEDAASEPTGARTAESLA